MYWDSTYILLIIGGIISAIASLNVNQTYAGFHDLELDLAVKKVGEV